MLVKKNPLKWEDFFSIINIISYQYLFRERCLINTLEEIGKSNILWLF